MGVQVPRMAQCGTFETRLNGYSESEVNSKIRFGHKKHIYFHSIVCITLISFLDECIENLNEFI